MKYEEELRMCCEMGNIEMLNKIINDIDNINFRYDDGCTALMYACENGNKEVIETLINHGADVNAKDIHQKTALMYACEKRNEDAVRVLLNNNADVNAKNVLGKTSIMYACVNEDVSIIEWLIKQGANVNEKDRLGCTALMYASYYAKENSVKALLKSNVKINEKDNVGKTALIYACYYSNLNIIHALLENGIDINSRSSEGTTALNRAFFEDNKHLMKYLLLNGADTSVLSKSEWEMVYREDAVLKIVVSMVNNDAKGLLTHLNAYYRNLGIEYENANSCCANLEKNIDKLLAVRKEVVKYIDMGIDKKKKEREDLKKDIKFIMKGFDDADSREEIKRIIKIRNLDDKLQDDELLKILRNKAYKISEVINYSQMFKERVELDLKTLILEPIYCKKNGKGLMI